MLIDSFGACTVCHGTGWEWKRGIRPDDHSEDGYYPCDTCEGTGVCIIHNNLRYMTTTFAIPLFGIRL